MRPWSSTFSTTSKPSAAIPRAHETSASPPSGRSCATPRCASQLCCPSHNASWRFPSSASTGPVLDYLSRDEITAIIDAPDRSTWSGQRDAVLFAVLYNTGARVSEMIRLHVADVLLDRASSLLLHGKGREERVVPLWKSTATQLRAWLPRIDRSPDAPVFPNRAGKPLSRSGVEHQLRVACRKASQRHPALATRRISPHTLRHTTAMHLLQSGVDITVIALWLGREDTGHHPPVRRGADLAMKEAALRRVEDPRTSATPLHRHRSTPRLSGSPLTMRSTTSRNGPHLRGLLRELRIVRNSA